jgi:hypothetical protein
VLSDAPDAPAFGMGLPGLNRNRLGRLCQIQST